MQKKELSVIILVAAVAIVALLIFSMNAGTLSALSTFSEENLIGQAVSALAGKSCGTSQKAVCQQQQTRCATMKGTWKGYCSTCTIKCEISKKK